MRFSLYMILLVSTFILIVTCTDATNTDPPSDSKKMEVKKALSRLRKMHRADTEERIVPPVAAYYHMLHSTPSRSTQSSQILRAVKDDTPLPKSSKAVVAVVSVGIVTGAIIGTAMFAKMLNQSD